MRGKIYTLDELDRALPLIRAITGDIRNGYALLRAKLEGLGLEGRPHHVDRADLILDLPAEIHDLVQEIRGYMGELGELGLYLRDPESGLVEAYGEQEGHIVYFSWKPGEERVRFYHGLFGSHRERKPVLAAV
jgi:hypothetical protein